MQTNKLVGHYVWQIAFYYTVDIWNKTLKTCQEFEGAKVVQLERQP
jgi:hypothetical protein